MGPAVETGKIMTHGGIEAFDAMGFRFGDGVFVCGQKLDVRAPAVGTVAVAAYRADPVEELFPRPIITIPALEVDGPFAVPIISDPDPKFSCFFWT